MYTSNHSSERGQAVVLVVLAVVVLLGFTAVAVDGSMVYSDRRYAQNSADATSLAGGSTAAQRMEVGNITYNNWTATPPNCSGHVYNAVDTGLDAGKKRAADNGFTIDKDISDNHGVVAECNVTNKVAPVVGGGTATIFVDKYADIKSVITDDTDTAFAHFVFGGLLKNTVTAVTRIRPRSPLAFGYAIVALNKAACSGNKNGIQFKGLGGNKNGLIVDGGGVFSNGCMDVDGNPNVEIRNAGAFYFYTANNNDLDDLQFTPSNQALQLEDNDLYRIPFNSVDITPPDCSGREFTSNELVGYADAHPSNPELPAGLYCVTDQLRMNNHERLLATSGVTLVLYNGAKINGGADIRLQTTYQKNTGAIPGLVVYQPPSSSADIEWEGNADSIMRGTMLAPKATITFNGNNMTRAIMSQIIGYNVIISGSTDAEVTYYGPKQATIPAQLELHR